MAPNPYVQAALTYFRRSFSSWKGGVLFIFLLVLVAIVATGILAFSGIGNHPTFHVLELLPFVLLFLGLAVHAKDQFADSRAHLLPGFRRVHATIAAAAAVVFAVFLPAVFSWLLGWHSIGFVAIAVLLLGAVFWLVLLFASLPGWLGFLMVAGILFLSTHWGQGCGNNWFLANSSPKLLQSWPLAQR